MSAWTKYRKKRRLAQQAEREQRAVSDRAIRESMIEVFNYAEREAFISSEEAEKLRASVAR